MFGLKILILCKRNVREFKKQALPFHSFYFKFRQLHYRIIIHIKKRNRNEPLLFCRIEQKKVYLSDLLVPQEVPGFVNRRSLAGVYYFNGAGFHLIQRNHPGMKSRAIISYENEYMTCRIIANHGPFKDFFPV